MRRVTDKAKENWIEEQCKEIEEIDKKGRSDLMYLKAKEIGKKYKRSNRMNVNILHSQGNILKEKEKIMDRWKEYFEHLYDAAGKSKSCDLENEDEVNDEDKGPQIFHTETVNSIAN